MPPKGSAESAVLDFLHRQFLANVGEGHAFRSVTVCRDHPNDTLVLENWGGASYVYAFYDLPDGCDPNAALACVNILLDAQDPAVCLLHSTEFYRGQLLIGYGDSPVILRCGYVP